MRTRLRVLLAGVLAAVPCTAALAGSSASVVFSGPSLSGPVITQGTTSDFDPTEAPGAFGFALDTPGAVFQLFSVRLPMRAGETADLFYDYAITVRDDGLPADRPWGGYIPPLRFASGAPPATGNELAAVSLVAGVFNPIFNYVNVSGDSVRVSTDGGSFADGVTHTGRLHVQVAVTPNPSAPFVSTMAQFNIYALASVDANPVTPVPEPATLALVLAGLSTIALKARRRRR